MGDRTAKHRLSVMRVTESQFADDVALSWHALEQASIKFVVNA